MLADPNPLLVLSLVLVAGAAGGTVAKRLRLPAVTGQILAGILLGPSVIHLFPHAAVARLEPVIDFALGLMAVAVGSHLHLRRLRNAVRRLALLVLLEATVTPLLVLVAIALGADVSWQTMLLLAAIAVSTAPATILAIVKETRSKGIFVKTLVAAVALNNLACICLFELAHAAAARSLDPGAGAGLLGILFAPVRQVLLSAALGGGMGVLLIRVTRSVVRPDRLAAASMVAILLTVGAGMQFGVSRLLSCLFLGVALANLTPDKEELGHKVFANFEFAIFAVFFTLAGMELDFRYVLPGGAVALLAFLARGAGKGLAAYGAMRLAGATRHLRRWLGPALIPQAGLAVGLMLLVTEDPRFASMRDTFLAQVLTLVLANELVGPLLTRFALARSGDLGKDRARLIDFLHEENIVTNLPAGSKEEALGHLAEVLIRSNRLPLDKEALLGAVRDREAQGSTCLGSGLAIPHGRLPEGDSMVGAMGISREGIEADTPDGVPIHCMILLATPDAARDHHLEVLAAFARAIGVDASVRQQLYQAKSPAHAYDLLHAGEDAEDWNYFLD